jgi:hypothetical protein
MPFIGGRQLTAPQFSMLVLFGTALLKFDRLLGKSDEWLMLGHIQNTLAARIDDAQIVTEAKRRLRMTCLKYRLFTLLQTLHFPAEFLPLSCKLA